MAIIYDIEEYRKTGQSNPYSTPGKIPQKFTFSLTGIVEHSVVTTLSMAEHGLIDPAAIISAIKLEIEKVRDQYEEYDVTF